MKMNRAMAEYLRTAPKADSLPAELSELLDEGFVEQDRCLLFRRFAKRLATSSASDFPDKTGREAFVNHLHIDDYADVSGAPALAALGVSFAERLSAALSKLNEQCVVIVSTDDVSCSVRFHRRRDGEAWLADDLESYRDDGIAVLET